MAVFKLPSLSKRDSRLSLDIPTFSWKDVTNKEEIGSGAFGNVYCADYREGNSSLSNLLRFADEEFDFQSFEKVQVCIARDIAEGLVYLHDNNVSHRDLKPSNILVTNQYYTEVSMTESERTRKFG